MVILATTVSVFALGFVDDVSQPAPVVGQSAGTLEPNPPGTGSDSGLVSIRHEAGDTIRTVDMKVIVDATDACGKRGRLVNLPVDGYGGKAIGAVNIEGDDIFDERPPYFGGPEYSALHRATYSAGDEIRFRIPNTDCQIRDGDRVTVRVVHTPTNSVIIKRTLTAR